MNRLAPALTAVMLLAPLHASNSQTLDARRMALGGVTLASGASGSSTGNVAYRAVPGAPNRSAGFALPIGLLALLSDPPTFDSDDPEFNIYELANLAYNPPWHLQLSSPAVPSNDIVVSVGRNSLSVKLGEVGAIFPEDGSRFGALARLPTLGFGIKSFFAGVSGLVDYENDLSLNRALRGALANGEAFTPNTEYALFDDARGQAAGMLEAGWASALSVQGDPRALGSGIYAGIRVKLLRGLAYADAHNEVSFTTRDTLFGDSPIDLQYQGLIHEAGPDGGGIGAGFDLGAAWLVNGFELGVGINDIGTTLNWKVRERVSVRDSAGDYEFVTVGEDIALTSKVPVTATVNVARRFGATLVAADYVRRGDNNLAHVGVERWFGIFALRSGVHLEQQQMQFAGGMGVRVGRVGLDLGLGTHNRTITRERGLELAAGLSLYP